MHVPGRLNVAADALSRNNISVFFMQAPQVDSQQTAVAPAPVSLLSQDLTWTCKRWIKLSRNSYFAAGLAPAAHKTYQSSERRYLEFCGNFSLVYIRINPLLFCCLSGPTRPSSHVHQNVLIGSTPASNCL